MRKHRKGKYIFTLFRQRNFALLWLADFISIVGDWALLVGLPIYVYIITQSALATSAMFLAGIIPKIVLGSVAGVFADRWNRKQMMIVTNLLLAAVLLPLLFFRSTGWLWVVYVVACAESAISQFFIPAEEALLPALVKEGELVTANSLNSLSTNIARLIGPSLGGIIVGISGLSGVVILDAISFLIAGSLIALIAVDRGPTKSQPPSRSLNSSWVQLWQEWIEGLLLVKRRNHITLVFVVMGITALGEAIFSVLFIVFVSKILHGGALELGWLMSAQAVGSLIGGLLIGHLFKGVFPSRLISLSSITFGCLSFLIFNYPAFFSGIGIALILFVFAGIAGVGLFTGLNTLLQIVIEDEFRGRIFGALNTTSALLMLVGTVLAGLLGNWISVVLILSIQSCMYILAGLLVLSLLRTSGLVRPEPIKPEAIMP